MESSQFQENALSLSNEIDNAIQIVDTIVIDEDGTQENDVIEITDENESDKFSELFISIQKENKVFSELLEKCLELDSSDGMMRIIERTIIRLYKEASEAYKKSLHFDRIINKAIICLENDPDRKFTYIKEFCVALKTQDMRKKIQLTTLAKTVRRYNKDGTPRKRKRRSKNKNTGLKKRQKIDIVDLSDDEDDVTPVIDLDDNSDPRIDSTIVLDGEKENIEEITLDDNSESDDELQETVEIMTHNKITSPKNGLDNIKIKVHNNIESPKKNTKLTNDSSPNLLVPKKVYIVNDDEASKQIEVESIEHIENQIEYYKEILNKYEMMEVDADSPNSAYMRSEKVKAKIVQLYKKLCTLTGDTPVKRREVRLQVTQGHPPGPVVLLENLINSNIGSDGEPHFPDFHDVVKCVMQANSSDKLGWKMGQILGEARSLFRQCGRALQKRRQQRDWRIILSRVKKEDVDQDPADTDPELQAKLEANKRLAMKRETDCFERFSETYPEIGIEFRREVNGDSDSDASEEAHMNSTEESIEHTKIDDINNISNENVNIACNENISDAIPLVNKIKFENDDDSKVKMDIDIEEVKLERNDDQDTGLELENNRIENEPNKVVKVEKIEDVEVGLNIENDEPNKLVKVEKTEEVNLKQENVEDVFKVLQELGDNYTTSIVGIEDPFLVIEISSDEDSEED